MNKILEIEIRRDCNVTDILITRIDERGDRYYRLYTPTRSSTNRFDVANKYGSHPKQTRWTVFTYIDALRVTFRFAPFPDKRFHEGGKF